MAERACACCMTPNPTLPQTLVSLYQERCSDQSYITSMTYKALGRNENGLSVSLKHQQVMRQHAFFVVNDNESHEMAD